MTYLELVGLKDHAHGFPELRADEAAVWARAPAGLDPTLLMDEPFAALDAISKRIMRKELLRFRSTSA